MRQYYLREGHSGESPAEEFGDNKIFVGLNTELLQSRIMKMRVRRGKQILRETGRHVKKSGVNLSLNFKC